MKKTAPLSPEQQSAVDKQAVITALQKVISDPKAKVLDKTRAAETLGRLAEYSWFAKPQDPTPEGETISESTAKTLAALANKLLEKGRCPKCGAEVLL